MLQKVQFPRRSLVWFITSILLTLVAPFLSAGSDQFAAIQEASRFPMLGHTFMMEREILYEATNPSAAISDIPRHRLYVGYQNSVVVYNTNSGTVIATIANVNAPGQFALSADGSQLVVSKAVDPYQNGLITVINTNTFQITAQHIYPYTPGGVNHLSPLDMAVGPGNRLYLAPPTWSDYAIHVMDLTSGGIVSSILLGSPTSSVAYHLEIAPGSQFLYLASVWNYPPSPILRRYDISAVQPVEVDTEPVPFHAGSFRLAADESYILLADPISGTVRKHRASDLALVSSWTVPLNFFGFEWSDDNETFHLARYNAGPYGPAQLLAYSAIDGTQLREYMDVPGVEFGRALVSLANGRAAIFYSDRLRILQPADYGVALPIVFNDNCMVPIVDHFDDPASGWPIENTTVANYGYANGEYNIFMKLPNSWAGATAGHVWDNSLRLQVKGRILQHDGVWGLILGLNNNWTDFYTFEVWPNEQRWFLWHYVSSQGWTLVHTQIETIIQTGSAFNTLRVDTESNWKVFSINDFRLQSFYIPGGRVGLSASGIEHNVDIRYDDYIFVGENCPYPNQVPGSSPGSGWFGQESVSPLLDRPPLDTFIP